MTRAVLMLAALALVPAAQARRAATSETAMLIVSATGYAPITIPVTGSLRDPVTPTFDQPTVARAGCQNLPPRVLRGDGPEGWTTRGHGRNEAATYQWQPGADRAGACWTLAFAMTDGSTRTFTLLVYA